MVAAMASMELIAGSSVGGEFDFDFSVDGLGAFLAGSVRLLCGGFFVAGRGRTLVAWYGFWIERSILWRIQLQVERTYVDDIVPALVPLLPLRKLLLDLRPDKCNTFAWRYNWFLSRR